VARASGRRKGLCEDCGHVHGGGFCAEVCDTCILGDEDYDADELGLDPEEEYDA
jgi:hypothetical protein